MFHPTGEPGPYPAEASASSTTLKEQYQAAYAERRAAEAEIVKLQETYNGLDLPRENPKDLDEIGYQITALQGKITELDRTINAISSEAILNEGADPSQWQTDEAERTA